MDRLALPIDQLAAEIGCALPSPFPLFGLWANPGDRGRVVASMNAISKTAGSSPKCDTMDPAARIELYVPERAVARNETAFQQWVETVTAPLRYVCVGNGPKNRFCPTPPCT